MLCNCVLNSEYPTMKKLLAGSLIGLLCCTSTLANEVIVNSTNNMGPGSLREAISLANNNDTIYIDVKGAISLSTPIVIDGFNNLSIIGPSAKHNSIEPDAGFTGGSNLFLISNCNQVHFSHLGFRGAGVQDVRAFELQSNNSSTGEISFNRCLFEGFNMAPIADIGGAISTRSPSTKITSCSFINNSAYHGGAIDFGGIASNDYVVNCTFHGNTSSFHGGAIFVRSSPNINFIHNTFKENSASGLGEIMHIDIAGPNVNLQNNAGAGNGGEDQFNDFGGGGFTSSGGNIFLQGGSEAVPSWIALGPDQYNTGITPGLRPTILEDGFGLKYFPIANNGSSYIDQGVNSALPAKDQRNAPRILTGIILFEPDAGACEYTQLRVTNTNNSGAGSLNNALSTASDPENYVEFDIVGAGPHTISDPAGIVVLTTTFIDGFSQHGSAVPGPQTQGTPGVFPANLKIIIDNPGSVLSGVNVTVPAAGSTVQGLRIINFLGNGVYFSGSGSSIKGCEVGIDETGAQASNQQSGILVNTDNIVIGGKPTFMNNVISGNGGFLTTDANVYLNGSAVNTIIQGNLIGTSHDGLSSVAAIPYGVRIQGNTTFIGKEGFGTGNVISGNDIGIYCEGCSEIKIVNSKIGVDYNGLNAVPNTNFGIFLSGSGANAEIGSISESKNIISANGVCGIMIADFSSTLIRGNLIGTDKTGNSGFGGAGIGILVNSNLATSTNIGPDNLISDNNIGVEILQTGGGTFITGNSIGLNRDGNAALENTAVGININDPSGNATTIGIPGSGNIVSGHNNPGSAGIYIGSSDNHVIQANLIGLNPAGNSPFPNERGIVLDDCNNINIGGNYATGEGNTISANTFTGIDLNNGCSSINIYGNFIGTDNTGNNNIGNGQYGINVLNSSAQIGVNPSTKNVISGNTLAGIITQGTGNTFVSACFIGTNISGNVAIPNGIGIQVDPDHDISISGDFGIGTQNIISGNTNEGILIQADNAFVDGNIIGLGAAYETTGMGNGTGIRIDNNVMNSIGSSQGNVIANNVGNGLEIVGSDADNNYINGNYFGVDEGLSSAYPNGNNGIFINDGDFNYIGLGTANYIISNANAGITLASAADNNEIHKNYIGDYLGLGQTNLIGINITGGSEETVVGGNRYTNGNYIVGNTDFGIYIDNSRLSFIYGNYIGNDGTNIIPNGTGINPVNSNRTFIGNDNSTGTDLGNIISGNLNNGIELSGSDTCFIYGNVIGVDETGSNTFPNDIGIYIGAGSDANVIGSNISNGYANSIVANTTYGIEIEGTNNLVQNNSIGLTGYALNAIGTQPIGIRLSPSSSNNQIGGDVSIQANYITANSIAGVVCQGTGNEIYGNYFGYNSGFSIQGTQDRGVILEGVTCNGNSIGAIPATQFGNTFVAMNNSGILIQSDANNNSVTANFIGQDQGGAVPNIQPIGVEIFNGAGITNLIGASFPGGQNYIGGNNIGVSCGAPNQTIRNNWIGLTSAGNVAQTNDVGIELHSNASNTKIGGSLPNEPNHICSSTGPGIRIIGSTTFGNEVFGNYIGLGPDMATVFPNQTGIRIEGGSDANLIGDPASANGGNIIDGTTDGAIMIQDVGTNDQEIYNNKIGENQSNTYGIVIANGPSGNLIGGGGFNERNYVINCDSVGIGIYGSIDNHIKGNYVGLMADGTSVAGNMIGIFLTNADNNTIGGSGANEQNMVQGNTEVGIMIDNGSDGNTIQNNYIGTDISGNFASASTANKIGMICRGGMNNQIGGDFNADEGNIICGNLEEGIIIHSSSLSVVEGNNIGISLDLSSYIGNGGAGMLVYASNNNFIGQVGNGHENVIAANADGIVLYYSNDNTLSNNFIGNDAIGGTTGGLSGSNTQQNGIVIDSTSSSNSIQDLNVISGNTQYGIKIAGNGTNDNTIVGNHIGVDITGNTDYQNGFSGIFITDSAKLNVIGGFTAADRNIISGNSQGWGLAQIVVEGANTDSTLIVGNYIGCGLDGTTTFPTSIGIKLQGSSQYTHIGGIGADARNYIVGHSGDGLVIQVSQDNRIMNNSIGVDATGTPSGNGGNGISLLNGNSNYIGGLLVASDSANVIANNADAGVSVASYFGISSYGNPIIGNEIYNNGGQGIDLLGDNAIMPIDTVQNLGNNGEMDIPQIVSAFDCGGTTKVGVIHTLSNTLAGYRIEFYTNSSPDANGYGEGETYLGSWLYNPVTQVDTITIDLGVSLPVGTSLTATMTGTLLNTSEFAQNFIVSSAPSPPVAVPTDETCLGANNGAIEVTASDAYYFSIDGLISSNYGNGSYTFTDQSPGPYTIDVTYLNGCTAQTSTTLNDGPALTFVPIIEEDTCGLNTGSITFSNESGSPGPWDYSFNGGSFYAGTVDTTNLAAGNYDLLLFDPALGCYSVLTNVTVPTVDDVVDESFVFDDFCPSPSVGPSSVATAGGTFTFETNPGDGSILLADGTLNNSVPGSSYTIIYTVGQCDEKDTVIVNALNAEDPSFTFDDFCLGAIQNISTTTAGGSFQFDTAPGNGASIDPVTGEITAIFGGSYDVEYITGGQCPDSSVVTVTAYFSPSTPQIITADSIYCNGENPATMTIASPGSDTYAWYIGDTSTTAVSVTTDYTPTVLNDGNNYFFVVATSANGCNSAPDSINYFLSNGDGMYASEDIEICIGSEFQLNAYGGETYTWSPTPNLSDLTVADPVGSISVEETFIVEIVNADGCVVVDSVQVAFLPLSQCNVDTYNAFSPNEDGTNDTWIIDGIEGYQENTVFIYNRWGDQILKLENYDNTTVVWDGSNGSGEIVPAGTYFYVVEVNGDQNQSGFIQVLR